LWLVTGYGKGGVVWDTMDDDGFVAPLCGFCKVFKALGVCCCWMWGMTPDGVLCCLLGVVLVSAGTVARA